MKLLIVDDEPIIRQGIKKLMDYEALGIEEIYEAANGAQALNIFREMTPDIILADINMPKINGLEFAQKVKTERPSTKLALITGYDYFDYAQKALRIGVEDYVLKPVSREDIQQLLHRLTTQIRQESVIKETKTLVDQYQSEYGSAEDEGYKKALIEGIEAGVGDPSFSLQSLADHVGLSPGYTSGLCKKYFQMSFKEFLLKRRMEKAKILLLSTDMKHYEISEAVGYADPNYFSTAFKKHTDMSPGKYREKAGRDL